MPEPIPRASNATTSTGNILLSCFMLENPPVASRLGGGFSGGALVSNLLAVPFFTSTHAT
jgi:hypothetical protein